MRLKPCKNNQILRGINMQHYTIEQLAAMLLAEKQQQYNNFKQTIDRKYALYSLLQHKQKPYKLHKMMGSHQIIIYDQNGVEIYNSDTETKQQINSFADWFMQIITNWLKVNHPNGIDF